jgi:diguanylate cyclase (GGDEF)-like protein
MPPTAIRYSFAVLALGVGLHALHAVTGVGHGALDSVVTDWVYTACELLGTALALTAAVRRRRERAAWTAIGIGLLLWSCGDLVWTLWLNALKDPPYPNVSDGLYLGSYLAVYAGVILLLRARMRPLRSAQWLEGAVGALTIAAIAAALVAPTLVDVTKGNVAEVVVNLAYPVEDLGLLSLVVGAMAMNRWRLDRSWVLLGLGQACNAVADAVFSYQEAAGTYVAGSWVDTLWPLGMALTALAAWQRTPVRTVEDLGSRTLPFTVGFAAVALGVLLVGQFSHVDDVAALLAASALVLAVLRGAQLFRDNVRLLAVSRHESLTDGLSGLPNRRALMIDLEQAAAEANSISPRTLALFDLDGFKQYNDAFGHAAGDALLRRLGIDLQAAVDGHGHAYRLGGDEFCALLDRHAGADDPVILAAVASLSESAEPYAVDASYGLVTLPHDAVTAGDALRLADHRMYALKHGRRATQGQAREVLLAVLAEREPDLQRHMRDVASLARVVGRQLGLDAEDLDVVVRAAELHDIGKVAIPDAILHNSGPLGEEEWAFVRQHTVIGERIVNAAEALRPVGRVVRSSHERWDGGGYPDGLAGEDIPLGARIVLACDAWDAMTSDRSYRDAIGAHEAAAELRRHAGRQFDPDVVEALLTVVLDGDRSFRTH